MKLWYGLFTNDVSFIGELRICLRYITASVVNRLLSIDGSRVITKNLLPSTVKHIDDYLCMERIAKLKKVDINNITVEYLGKRLHIAVTNRKNELSYLRHLTACLLPHVLPPNHLKCR